MILLSRYKLPARLRKSAQERESREGESLGAINEVWQVEIRNVVADDDVRINLR